MPIASNVRRIMSIQLQDSVNRKMCYPRGGNRRACGLAFLHLIGAPFCSTTRIAKPSNRREMPLEMKLIPTKY